MKNIIPVAFATVGLLNATSLLWIKEVPAHAQPRACETRTCAGVPAGTILPYAGSTAPAGYMFADGSAVDRSVYPELFAAISTNYGPGVGPNGFNLPDLNGRSVIGRDDMSGTPAGRITAADSGVDGTLLGGAGGAQAHTFTDTEMPSHSHGPGSLSTGGQSNGHIHAMGTTGPGNNPNASAFGSSGVGSGVLGTFGGFIGGTAPATSGNLQDHSHSVTAGATGAAGGGAQVPMLPPSIVLNYIIKY